jgi:glucosyl-3-phosphoglycerate synthase
MPIQIIKNNAPPLKKKSNDTGYVSVVIPALNEAKRIADVVSYAFSDPATAEVIVVDDSSIDDTAAQAKLAGAHVVIANMLGKGGSMCDGMGVAKNDIIVYLDGDLAGLRPGIITDLSQPMLENKADFVKARFGRGGGRVTVLTAKPMLHIFFPEVAHFAQPLGGIIAARKTLLQSLKFEDGYGVDVALLIDAHLAGAALVEVDIGFLENDSQPLHDLSLMANEVGRVIFNRARTAGRLNVEQIGAMYESQRLASSGIEYVLTRRKGRRRLLLLDMDYTVTDTQFVDELARVTGQHEALKQLYSDPIFQNDDKRAQKDKIAYLFRFVHMQKFDEVARQMTIRPGVIEFVNKMRRQGFMVGVLSDSYFVAADIIRRRIFADFAMAHTIQFDGDVCNGQLNINPAFLSVSDGGFGFSGKYTHNQSAKNGINSHKPMGCKSNVLRCFLANTTSPSINLTWVVGADQDDLELMQLADHAFAIGAISPDLQSLPYITRVASFEQLMTQMPIDN